MPNTIVTLTKNNIDDIIGKSNKPVVIDVFASWCGPCMSMKPSFEQLAEELADTHIFAEINVDESRDLAINFNVTSVPTFIFIKNKQVVGRETGYMSKDELKSHIDDYCS